MVFTDGEVDAIEGTAGIDQVGRDAVEGAKPEASH
jgi:hypothetical protein